MFHKFTFFLVNGKDVGTWTSTMAKDDGGSEMHYASVTASTLDTMNKIDGKVKVRKKQSLMQLLAITY